MGYACVGEQKPTVVFNGNKTPVKHPVRGPAQCYSISNRVRPMACNRSDMSGVHFRTAAAVDQPKARHRTTIVVGPANLTPKRNVAKLSVRDGFDNWSIEIRHWLGDAANAVSFRSRAIVFAEEFSFRDLETGGEYRFELMVREQSHRTSEGTFACATIFALKAGFEIAPLQ